ncbi:hypothetical protein MCOR03_009035 [Pyricularia oryzae]|nr:hypothetical protein MCOR19_004814 [Pyricularia oryzae]KAI6284753.1 hypothetical protein MCOR26_001876 [Pyricularia oryzae]KAI6337454.1 hypothetical protein MCOR28_008534 [Pyricularia oryzae]KAI6398430.1 hypothetical protein MCOR20_009223 [Pyricularia oryzae]KAI6423076.1 hypothetical protein MCOR21_008356 [Pyricularia oryzae]
MPGSEAFSISEAFAVASQYARETEAARRRMVLARVDGGWYPNHARVSSIILQTSQVSVQGRVPSIPGMEGLLGAQQYQPRRAMKTQKSSLIERRLPWSPTSPNSTEPGSGHSCYDQKRREQDIVQAPTSP